MAQEKLNPVLPPDLSVKIIGLGGVGAIIGRYVSLFLSADKWQTSSRVVFIDGDEYEPKNKSRMLFKKIGNKAKIMREELLEYLADTNVCVLAIPKYLTKENIADFIHEGDVVFVAVDNHKTRNLVNAYAETLDNICVISAGNDPQGENLDGKALRGTYGNCQTYVRKDREDVTNSLTKWHPEIADPKDSIPTEQNCTDLVTSVPQVLFTNMQAAACACQSFYRFICGMNHGEVAFDIYDGKMQPIPYPAPKKKEETISEPLIGKKHEIET